MNTIISNKSWQRIAVSDMLILALVYFMPAIIHLTSLPLYILEPMRIFVFLGLILSGNKWNTYILALSIPLFSFISVGHPPFFKALLISTELFLNIWLFIQISQRGKMNLTLALFISIVLSKLIYYSLKYAFLSYALIEGNLIGIALPVQLGVAIFLSFVIAYFVKREKLFDS